MVHVVEMEMSQISPWTEMSVTSRTLVCLSYRLYWETLVRRGHLTI